MHIKYALSVLPALMLAVLIASSLIPGVIITPDGEMYLQYARRILTSTPITPFDSISLRTPLFPFMLAVGELLCGNIIWGMQIAHVVVLLVTLFGCMYALRPLLPYWLAATLIVIGLIPSFIFFNVVLTEWISICVATFASACFVRYFYGKNPSWANIGVLLLVAGVLIRPAMVSFIPALLLLTLSIRPWKDRLVYLSFFFTPLLIWITFHRYSYGSFAISNLGPIALFGSLTVNLNAEANPTDPPILKLFSEEFHQNRFPRPQSGEKPLGETAIADKNMWYVADTIRVIHGWSYLDFAHICTLYNRKLMTSKPGEILRTWWRRIRDVFQYMGIEFFLFPLAIAFLLHLHIREELSKKNLAFLKTLGLLFVFFLLHTVIAVAVHPPLPRYFFFGWNIFTGCLILVIGAIAYDALTRRTSKNGN